MAHFKAEYGDLFIGCGCGVFGYVHCECGFADARPCGNDYKVALLKAARKLVQLLKPRRHAAYFALGFHKLAYAHIRFQRAFVHGNHCVLVLFHGYIEYAPFGFVQYIGYGGVGIAGGFYYFAARGYKLAQNAPVLYYFNIVAYVGCAGDKKRKLRNVAYAAGGSQLARPLQRIHNGNAVHGLGMVDQVAHGFEYILMLRHVKILNGQHLCRKFGCIAADEHAAQHAFFRLQRMRGSPCFHFYLSTFNVLLSGYKSVVLGQGKNLYFELCVCVFVKMRGNVQLAKRLYGLVKANLFLVHVKPVLLLKTGGYFCRAY